MIKRFLQGLRNTIHPFSVMAEELRVIRELYELDLQSREKPIIRITEKPSPLDTIVLFGDEQDDKEKTRLQRLADGLLPEREDDEDAEGLDG